MIEFVRYLCFIEKLSKFLRKIGFRKLVIAIRNHSSKHITSTIRETILPEISSLRDKMEEWDTNEPTAAEIVESICTEINNLVKYLVGLEDKKHCIHTCIKVLVTSDDNTIEDNDDMDRASVETWMRSQPRDGREDSLDDIHTVTENTTWCALVGKYDGNHNWARPYYCFSSNDLTKYEHEYENSREGYANYYKSTIVLPIEYEKPHPDNTAVKIKNIIGFLAVDSNKKDIFKGMPEIFEYKGTPDGWSKYHEIVEKSSIYQVLAIISNTLSMILSPIYDEHAQKEGEDE